MSEPEAADLRRMIDDIVNVEGTEVQERREAIAHGWVTTFLNRGFMKVDYQKERDLEHFAIMTAMIASGFATKDGVPPATIAVRAIEIAKAILTKLREAK